MGTKFVKFIGDCALNHHMVEMRKDWDGSCLLRHELAGKRSGIEKSFFSVAEVEEFCGDLSGAAQLNEVLGKMGVSGFPAAGL